MFATIEERFYRLDYEVNGKSEAGSPVLKEDECSQDNCIFLQKIIEAEKAKVN